MNVLPHLISKAATDKRRRTHPQDNMTMISNTNSGTRRRIRGCQTPACCTPLTHTVIAMQKILQFTMFLVIAASATAATLPPAAPVRPVTDDYFGTKITDNYRWMENLKDPEMQHWMKAQADHTRAKLDALPSLSTDSNAAKGLTTVVAFDDGERRSTRSMHAADPLQLFPGSTIVTRPRFSDEIVGTGPDIVFIPGLTSSRETWKATAERLRGRYRVHLIQVAGFAGEPPFANASGPVLAPTAEAIRAYLVEQHLTPATLVGHSLGGTMVLYLAERHPADIKKGMIIDAWPFYAVVNHGPTATADSMKPFANKIRSRTSPMTDSKLTQVLSRMASSQADRGMIRAWYKASDLTTTNNALADDLTMDLRPGLASITVPLTLVYPDDRPVGMPAGDAHQLYHGIYAAVPHMRFVEVSRSLHFLMLDQPAQFNAALDTFLAH